MTNFLQRFHLMLVSVLLLVTFSMTFLLILRFNQRWDMTPEKIYSLAPVTEELLSQMKQDEIEVLAFYPGRDAQRENVEIFLKACQLRHPNFHYAFYNPNRRPQLAKTWNVRELYTIIIRYQGQAERVVLPDEAQFSSALMRLMAPRKYGLCLLQEPGDIRLRSEDAAGFQLLLTLLADYNFKVETVPLENVKIPDTCNVLGILGPQSDWTATELNRVREGLRAKQSVLFLIDPMDPGTGKPFIEFMGEFGIQLYGDVIVDKMSRMVGGDFLLPFVNQYSQEHAVTAGFDVPTFYPVARSVHPVNQEGGNLDVQAIALSGSNSWGETDLKGLERGEAAFHTEADFPGPVPVVVAVEMADEAKPAADLKGVQGRRMLVVGDSDFVTNAYLTLSGNKDFLLRMLRWLARDERRAVLESQHPQFQPLFLSRAQQTAMLAVCLFIFPLFFFAVGLIQILLRRRDA